MAEGDLENLKMVRQSYNTETCLTRDTCATGATCEISEPDLPPEPTESPATANSGLGRRLRHHLAKPTTTVLKSEQS